MLDGDCSRESSCWMFVNQLTDALYCRNGSVIVIFIIVIQQRIPVQTTNQQTPLVTVSVVAAVLNTGLSNNVNSVVSGSTTVGGTVA